VSAEKEFKQLGADFETAPFSIIVDTREQAPYGFRGLRVRSRKMELPLVVMCERRKLDSGDYSIDGMEKEISIERKSLDDALSTFTNGHERFERELERLQKMKWAAILLEFEWSRILRLPPERIIRPQAIDGMIVAWQQRFPKVHWIWRPGRGHAEKACVNILRRYWAESTGQRVHWTII